MLLLSNLSILVSYRDSKHFINTHGHLPFVVTLRCQHQHFNVFYCSNMLFGAANVVARNIALLK